jgi:putative peptidoglycan lipid II flippase
VLLRRRLGTVHGRSTAATIARIAAASVPALLVTWAAGEGVRGVAGTGHLAGIVSLLVGLLAGGLAYVCAALLLRVGEVHDLVSMVQRRLGRA